MTPAFRPTLLLLKLMQTLAAGLYRIALIPVSGHVVDCTFTTHGVTICTMYAYE
jgi:hypothetical protein